MHRTSRRLIGGLLALGRHRGRHRLRATTAPAPAASAEGGWSFTDDLGTTVELDEAPTRIAGPERPHGLAVELRRRAGRHLRPDLRRGRRRLRGQGPLRRRDRRLEPTARSTSRRWPPPTPTSSSPRSTRPTPSGTRSRTHRGYGFERSRSRSRWPRSRRSSTIAYRGSARRRHRAGGRPGRVAGGGHRGGEVAEARADFEAASETLTEAAAERRERAAGLRHRGRRLVDGQGRRRPVAARSTRTSA